MQGCVVGIIIIVILWAVNPALAILLGLVLGGISWAVIAAMNQGSNVPHISNVGAEQYADDYEEIDSDYEEMLEEEQESLAREAWDEIFEHLKVHIQECVDLEEQWAYFGEHDDERLFIEQSLLFHREAIDQWLELAALRLDLDYDLLLELVEEYTEAYRDISQELHRDQVPHGEPKDREEPGRRQASGSSGTNCFAVLGLTDKCSEDEARKKFRSLAKSYHPDLVSHLAPEFKELAEGKMKEINVAYQEVLRLKGWT